MHCLRFALLGVRCVVQITCLTNLLVKYFDGSGLLGSRIIKYNIFYVGPAKETKLFIDMACYLEYYDYPERGLVLVGGE